jgi:hypothetical protein
MNETDFIRQQLAAERAHLREILLAVHQETGAVRMARPITTYIEWASRRLLTQLGAHDAALQTLPTLGAATRAQLTQVSAAAAQAADADATRPANVQVQRLLVLLEAWSDSLDAVAGATLRVGHWRHVAPLSADTILEERQLYAAARGAAGLT